MHRLRTKGRIAHTLGIAGKVIDRFFRHTAALPFGWEKRGELADRLNQFLNLAMREQRTSLLGPDAGLLAVASIDRMGDLPDMFFGMIEVDNLDRVRKVSGDYLPYPNRSIT